MPKTNLRVTVVTLTGPLIIARLNGGLGNQMFQFAAARALARRTGATLKLDVTAFARDRLRAYDLGVYALTDDVTLATPDELATCEHKKPRGLGRWLNVIGAGRDGIIPAIREAHFHYASVLETATAPAYVIGYWQSERYFAAQTDQIRFLAEIIKPHDAAY